MKNIRVKILLILMLGLEGGEVSEECQSLVYYVTQVVSGPVRTTISETEISPWKA